MSTEPPSDGTTDIRGERASPEAQDLRGTGNARRWRTVAVAASVLVLAGGVAAFLFLSSDTDPPTEEAKPTEGLACSHLLRAAEAHAQGDETEFDQEIARAAQVAEETLQNSGEVFGEPERIAVELELGQPEDVDSLLVSARDECSDLERPESG